MPGRWYFLVLILSCFFFPFFSFVWWSIFLKVLWACSVVCHQMTGKICSMKWVTNKWRCLGKQSLFAGKFCSLVCCSSFTPRFCSRTFYLCVGSVRIGSIYNTWKLHFILLKLERNEGFFTQSRKISVKVQIHFQDKHLCFPYFYL